MDGRCCSEDEDGEAALGTSWARVVGSAHGVRMGALIVTHDDLVYKFW